jgi:hypothetical protein
MGRMQFLTKGAETGQKARIGERAAKGKADLWEVKGCNNRLHVHRKREVGNP